MSKIVSMSSGAIDPIAQSKRVFFRPSAADTVRVGDLVCYNWDIDGDHKERSSDPTHLGLRDDDYAEGAQDYTGRLFIVEKPATANLQFFAGVVKALGPKAGADDDMIEIWVPNGAVLPVMCDQYCTAGRTIVGLRDGAYEGSYPEGRPIGIAMETIDRSTDDGLVWVKVDPDRFLWVEGDDNALTIDDEASGSDVSISKIRVTSAQTTGSVAMMTLVLNTVNTDGGSMMYWEYGNTGTGAGGMKLINAYVEASGTAIVKDVIGMKMQVNLLASSALLSPAVATGIMSKVHLKTGGGAHTGDVYAGRFELGLDDTTTGKIAMLYFGIAGAGTPDYFFEAADGNTVAYTADVSGTNQSGALKIYLGGVVHYLHTFDATAGAT